MAIDISKTMHAVETIAEQLGIDLTAYGNASPTKLILETLQTSVQIIQQTTKTALTEQNPLTATELRSKIGLAALVGLNPAKLMQASQGKVKVMTNGHTVTVGQHAKLKSYSNIDYYVILPNETVQFSKDTELIVRQGTLNSKSFVATGEAWESLQLASDAYIDSKSIEVFRGTDRLTWSYDLSESADCYVRPSYDGTTEIVMSNTCKLNSGESITVQYADCLGIDGDNMETDQYMQASDFAYEGDTDITNSIGIIISEPIVGGTDFENFDTDITNEIMLAGHNNLIGNESQLRQYLSRFKQYMIQTTEVSNGVYCITALRSLEQLCKVYDYFTACTMVDLRTADILALSSHINDYSDKSLDMVVSVKSAAKEQCRVNVDVQMTNPSQETILHTVTDYILSRINANSYDKGGLYKALIALDDVEDCNVSYDGNTNAYGSAVAKNNSAILLCTAANITVNGTRVSYGKFDYDANEHDLTIDRVTTEQMLDIKRQTK
jgi:hypothetical protein